MKKKVLHMAKIKTFLNFLGFQKSPKQSVR